MKGLYYQQNATALEDMFFLQEMDNVSPPSDYHVKLQVKACALSPINTKLVSEVMLEKESVPVGREVAGVIMEVGSKVSFFQQDDDVVGILPLDSQESGLSEVLWIHEHNLVLKPEKISWVEAAGAVRDGLSAYTALHFLAHLGPGKSVLIMDGASPFGALAVQLSQHTGAMVIATAYNHEDKQYLEKLKPSLARVLDLSKSKVDLAEACLEETGGLGVDIVIDAGVILYKSENSITKSQPLPHKHDIITLLSVGSHWVTREENLQLDPPDSHSLFLKGATVSFLNNEIWNLSNAQQGKYLHILSV
ncbi:quinone oxidoreductase 1 [Pelobates cultripes]|uniref:Quinone oxidoreductase 1 n=1 Tax=Pelobates cultripes TaxID=61616 RepID=A0AAD1VLQ6_PELCU|nr:quinone oxidoreductase 1 [Pelobates cultripes]